MQTGRNSGAVLAQTGFGSLETQLDGTQDLEPQTGIWVLAFPLTADSIPLACFNHHFVTCRVG